ncbi:TonB-dependent receptor, partial [Komagataeibacter sp. FXV3]|nr:TonB-dependent receptor [Komagataeibacter sp. FXV3]
MKLYFLRHSFRLLAKVPTYASLPALPCLLLASASPLAFAATTPASAQLVDKKHIAAHHRQGTAVSKASPEQITVTRSHAQRYLATPGTVNTISGKELRSLHLESPK